MFLTVIAAFVVLLSWLKWRQQKMVGNMPGVFQFIGFNNPLVVAFGKFVPRSIFGFDLLPIRPEPDMRNSYGRKYANVEKDVLSVCSFFTVGILVADPEVVKQVTTSKDAFPKDTPFYEFANLLGRNIVTTEGEEWKKHRRLAGPTFSERNNRLVHEQTLKLTLEFFDSLTFPAEVDILSTMTRLTLLIISAAGFGMEVAWKANDEIPNGHTLTFEQSITGVSTHLFQRIVFPEFVRKLPFAYFQSIETAFTEFKAYGDELIEKASNSSEDAGADLLNALVSASKSEVSDQKKLSPSELMGDVFIFMLAGHETTAHTLTYALGLLAVYPDVQAKVYSEIKEVIGDRLPNYEDFSSLEFTLAVFMEALRLYPPVPAIPRVAAKDVELAGYHVKAGTKVSLDIGGTHMNPNAWEDPKEFKPERFLKSYSGKIHSHAFLSFSEGLRSCLGKRFAQVEAVCILSTIVQKFRLETLKRTTEEELLDSTFLFTLTPKVPVILKFIPRA